MDLMRKVYLTQQEILEFMKEKRQDSLSPNLGKYYEARQEMNDWLKKDDLPEDTKATMYVQQLQRVNQLKKSSFQTRTISSPNDHTHGANHDFGIRQHNTFPTA